MNVNEAKKAIYAASLAKDAVLMEGVHGIGKSSIVRQFAKEHGYHLEELFLSSQEVADIIGNMRTKEEDGELITTWSIPPWLHRMNKASKAGIKCLLHLDEFNRSEQEIRQASLQLVLEGRIHEHYLPITGDDKTLIVASINPEDGYQVYELDPALKDRFLEITVEPDLKTFLGYADEINMNRIIPDFVINKPHALHFMSKDGRSSCTPRGLESCGRYFDNDDKIDPSIMFDLIKGKIGTEIGSELYMHYKNYNKVVKMEDIERLVGRLRESENNYSIEDIGAGIADLMKDSEVVYLRDMSKRLAKKYMDKKDIFVFHAFLYSLRVETLAGFLKGYRDDEPDMYDRLADIDDEVNGKRLFFKLVELADEATGDI